MSGRLFRLGIRLGIRLLRRRLTGVVVVVRTTQWVTVCAAGRDIPMTRAWTAPGRVGGMGGWRERIPQGRCGSVGGR